MHNFRGAVAITLGVVLEALLFLLPFLLWGWGCSDVVFGGFWLLVFRLWGHLGDLVWRSGSKAFELERFLVVFVAVWDCFWCLFWALGRSRGCFGAFFAASGHTTVPLCSAGKTAKY